VLVKPGNGHLAFMETGTLLESIKILSPTSLFESPWQLPP
jgi:hypothetical protein